MQKQSLSLPKKFVAASFAVLLAASSLTAMPSVAHAETTSAKDAVISTLNDNTKKKISVEAIYNESGTELISYHVYIGDDYDSEWYWNLGTYYVHADVSTTPYVADLSDFNFSYYTVGTDPALYVSGCGTQTAFLGYEGDEYVHISKGRLDPKGTTRLKASGEYVASKLSRIVFSKDSVTVYLKRTATQAYKEVEKAIDAIGEVTDTPECKARIEAAKEAYNWLPKYEKDLVSNIDALYAAMYPNYGL